MQYVSAPKTSAKSEIKKVTGTSIISELYGTAQINMYNRFEVTLLKKISQQKAEFFFDYPIFYRENRCQSIRYVNS